MELNSYFTDFLQEIRPTYDQRQDLITGHRTLRERLLADESLAPIIVSIFLQGSYRRGTAIRPKGGKRSDVDLVVVTRLNEQDYPNPEDAMKQFVPFLEKYYAGKYQLQGRSIGIELSYVDLDLVITSAPSETEVNILQSASVNTLDSLEDTNDWRLSQLWVPLDERTRISHSLVQNRLDAASRGTEWQLSPLRIPDRHARTWEDTHPLCQIQWTRDKNKACNTHYINVVKAIKWWRRVKHSTPKYPKGYPVEHLIGACCPDGISSVAEGITRTLEVIVQNYHSCAHLLGMAPDLRDHGVPGHNVFKRVTGEEFAEFYDQVCIAAVIAREALATKTVDESAQKWRELFGDKFPLPPGGSGDQGAIPTPPTTPGGFTERKRVSTISRGRFA